MKFESMGADNIARNYNYKCHQTFFMIKKGKFLYNKKNGSSIKNPPF